MLHSFWDLVLFVKIIKQSAINMSTQLENPFAIPMLNNFKNHAQPTKNILRHTQRIKDISKD